jgi:hypothetical protein
MTGLIDSLMENFYIPPIILNKATLADKSKPAVHICVDGKQRLSSVRAFVKGMVSHSCTNYVLLGVTDFLRYLVMITKERSGKSSHDMARHY